MGIGNTLVAFKATVSLSFKWVRKFILFLNELKGEGRPFLKGKRIDLPSRRYFTYGSTVNHYKSVHHPLSFCGNWEHLGSFQNKNQYALLSNECPDIFCSWSNWRKEESLFWESARMGAASWDYPHSIWLLWEMEKVSPFMKFEKSLLFTCSLLDPVSNKYCSACSCQ